MSEVVASQLTSPSGGGDRSLMPAEFARIAELLLREAGIELTESKRPLVNSRLATRLRSLGMRNYRDYCDYIESDDGQAERLEMLSVLTTNVTRFFREPHHFDYLRQELIPEISAILRKGGSARVWSAGCASGEEPYTLALTFLQEFPDIARHDFRILASDIDPAILRIASAGMYSTQSLAQVPEDQRTRYFHATEGRPDTWSVGPEIRRLVTFRRLNLIGSWPFSRQFDLIMCRNVVIYFSAETKAQVWMRLLQQLRSGGWLITGHSERLPDVAIAKTEPIHITTYRRRERNDNAREDTTCR